MGISITKDVDLLKSDSLRKFCSEKKIVLDDPFWDKLITFNLSLLRNRDEQYAFESKTEPYCQELLRNNLGSGNFGTLIDWFLIRYSELLTMSNSSNRYLLNWQSFNAMFITRCVLKFFTEILCEEDLIKHVGGNGDNSRLETLIGSLIGVLVDLPVDNLTYEIHLEATTTLLILLSMPVYSGRRPDDTIIFQLIMKGKHIIHAPLLIKNLMNNFINQEKNSYSFGWNQQHSIVLGIASGLWSILTFNNNSNDGDKIENFNFQDIPLACQSLLLVLVLVHHCTTQTNAYRNSLLYCASSEGDAHVRPTTTDSLFKINFDSLYSTLCARATGEAETLLLYLLLHQNSNFKSFLLARLDLENLVIPILKTLYNTPTSNSHHIYMSLIVLLILSEDDTFNRTIHKTKLKNIVWYTERALSDISLGGLLILIVIRTIQYNMLKMRDKYLHTNCLAALANMSSEFRNLHPYVSQRLVSLFETLARKYQRLVKTINTSKNCHETSVDMQNDSNLEQDVAVLEEVLRMVLEILNSCLTHQLVNNPNLVYTLLYKKHTFEIFKNNVVFQDIIHNIEIIIQYFSQLLTDKSQQYEVDAAQVLLTIQQGAKGWPKEKLTKFPELKFKYVEEESPEEFFIPYVWNLVNQQTCLHITNENTMLSLNS